MKTLEKSPKVKKLKKGDTILVRANRWFQKTYGNTYFSGIIYVNSEEAGRIDFEYGYGDHCVHQLIKLIRDRFPKDFFKDSENEPYWKLRDYGITIQTDVRDVNRKKDL